MRLETGAPTGGVSMFTTWRPGVASLAIVMACSAVAAAGRGWQQASFTEADAYERFMGRWSRELAPLLVRFAGVRDGEELLDVGAGTGALAVAIAAAAPSSHIVGIDPSGPYVEYANARHGNALTRFEAGDARHMRFETAAFDRTMSLLVLNFIPDAAKAVDEMKRVTRRGGVLAAAVWDYAEGMEMLRAFWDEAIPLNPGADAKDQRHMAFSHRGELAAMWRERGLRDVVEEPLTIETSFTSFDDYWLPFLEKQGSTGAYLAARPDAERAELERRLRHRLLGGGPDRPFTLHARAWAVRGVVP
jgi:ubiquinone/menaquinone biosynthesis C-methylase UbiE